ncbi:AT-hook motif nuclear-localized protein 29-like [Vicia villosa]|uniref:AT-hook motif nuclear-localized protein 29-like n=1 Tax=Vicia villosa TaxID=3911 RepID=UPI00273AB60F|nr:AT-hook motif nuclear-localized protein 29-like [Vicia villosa]
MSGHDVEKIQELQLFTTPQLQTQTQNINTTIDNNNPESPSTVVRRPRGRPVGSKNKPKTPIIVTCENPNALCPHVLEITDGADVLKSLFDYARRQLRGVSILNGNGVVTHARLRQPTGRVITLQGNFEILSIFGTIFPPPTPEMVGGLRVHLSGTKGHMIEGSVIPPLMASGPVTLTAVSFANIVPEKISSMGND